MKWFDKNFKNLIFKCFLFRRIKTTFNVQTAFNHNFYHDLSYHVVFLTQHFSLNDIVTLITNYTSGVTLIQTRFPLNLHLFGNLNNYSKQLETSKQSTSIIFKQVRLVWPKWVKWGQEGSSLFHDEGNSILE